MSVEIGGGTRVQRSTKTFTYVLTPGAVGEFEISVEVQVDDGPWQEAQLGRVASVDTWVQWRLDWDATPGEHRLAVRVTDATGRPQPVGPADPFPDGAEGYHEIRVTVSQ